jgi:hypothetical protein
MRVVLGRDQPFPLPTIIVSNARLKFLGACDGRHLGIEYHIDDRDTIESNHLLKIDVSALIAIHVLDRQAKVCPVPVRLEDVAPEWSWRFGRRQVQENGISARFEDGVCLFVDRWSSKNKGVGNFNRLTCCCGRIDGGN